MGIYLSTPKTEKFSEDGENERLRFGLSSMQGWRASMEDAHAALPDLDNCTSFFGVYDGHGGTTHCNYPVGFTVPSFSLEGINSLSQTINLCFLLVIIYSYVLYDFLVSSWLL